MAFGLGGLRPGGENLEHGFVNVLGRMRFGLKIQIPLKNLLRLLPAFGWVDNVGQCVPTRKRKTAHGRSTERPRRRFANGFADQTLLTPSRSSVPG